MATKHVDEALGIALKANAADRGGDDLRAAGVERVEEDLLIGIARYCRGPPAPRLAIRVCRMTVPLTVLARKLLLQVEAEQRQQFGHGFNRDFYAFAVDVEPFSLRFPRITSPGITGRQTGNTFFSRVRCFLSAFNLMFAQQPAVADNRGGDASQSQNVPQGHLSRGDDRSAGSRFQFLDDRVRAKIKASNDDAVARRIPGAEREVPDFFGRRLSETKAVADTHAGVGDRFDAACGKEGVGRGVNRLGIGRDRGHPLHADAAQAAKMLVVALVPGQPAILRISSCRCASNSCPCTMLEAVQP
jgi:hypothetical protein